MNILSNRVDKLLKYNYARSGHVTFLSSDFVVSKTKCFFYHDYGRSIVCSNIGNFNTLYNINIKEDDDLKSSPPPQRIMNINLGFDNTCTHELCQEMYTIPRLSIKTNNNDRLYIFYSWNDMFVVEFYDCSRIGPGSLPNCNLSWRLHDIYNVHALVLNDLLFLLTTPKCRKEYFPISVIICDDEGQNFRKLGVLELFFDQIHTATIDDKYIYI